MNSKKFTRKIENFTCLNCKTKVKGNGFTNHCPNCLWSRHVDIYPGDRASNCQGSMQPITYEIKKGLVVIEYQCQKCGMKNKNKMNKNDNQEPLLKLSETLAKNTTF